MVTIHYPSGKTEGSYDIPNYITTVGKNAFYICEHLTSLTIPNSVKYIEERGFYKCTGLTSVTIPNSIDSIGYQAFYNCTGLTSVHIDDLTAWCKIKFNNLRSNPTNYAHKLYLNGELIKDLVIPEDIEKIQDNAFYGCDSLISVTIPNNVTSIGDYAFCECTKIKDITNYAATPQAIKSNVWGSLNKSSCTLHIPAASINLYKAANGWKDFTKIEVLPNYDVDVVVWNLTDSVLTISGAGTMTDYSSTSSIPWYSYRSSIKSVVIEEGVTSIGDYAFYGCSSLTSVTISNSVTSIGYRAFYNCSSLTSITIPDGVTSIGYSAFYNCSSLTSIDIPNSVTSIGEWAFYNCSSLTSIDIPNSVTSIGYSAFYNCSSLTSVTIPNSVTSIGEEAFSGCSSLPVTDNLRYADTYLVGAVDKSLSSYSIKEGTKWIGNGAFSGCSSLTSVTIGNSVTSIGSSAFYGCSSLTSVEIPENVTSIGIRAFAGCDSLKHVFWNARSCNNYYSLENLFFSNYGDGGEADVISSSNHIETFVFGDSVQHIPGWLCYGMSTLTTIEIPNSVTSIGNRTFYNCSSLTSIIVKSKTPATLGYDAFNSTNNCPINVPIGTVNAYKSSWGEYASRIVASSVSGTCGDSLTWTFNPQDGMLTINGTGAMDNWTEWYSDYAKAPWYELRSYIKSVSLPEGLTNIGNDAFFNCSSLTSIEIPNSVTSIGNYAFYNCSSLTSIDIPNSVTSIGYRAFEDCSWLTSVTIGNNVTNIDDYAFRNCTRLKSIYAYPLVPPYIYSSTFNSISSSAIVYVPFGCSSVYKAANYWKKLTIQGPTITYTPKTTPTSCAITFDDVEGTELLSCGVEGGEQTDGRILEYIGLEPNSQYKNIPVVLTDTAGLTEPVNVSFSTTALELTTKPSQPVSSSVAILLAETNMSDAETSCGFEYKRNDAPADMDGTKVYCPVANGQMAGRLKNLKDDVYYKYRAFYQSAAGNMYYGDWQYIFTGDVAVEFDPVLYTYTATVVTETTATISGYALAGSEDFTEQGFEYWAESRTDGTIVANSEHFYVQTSGISMHATLTNLDAGTVYKYRAYAKVGEQYYYGSEQSFTTRGTYTPPTYTITFVNWDGTELQSSEVSENTMPEYVGETPTRPETAAYTYTFKGWTPEIVPATANATYTATYTAEEKSEGVENVQGDNVQCTKVVRGGQIFILRGDKIFTVTGQRVK